MVSQCISSHTPKKQGQQPLFDRFQGSLFENFESATAAGVLADSDPRACEAPVRSLDPARWAHLCRYLGNLTPKEFAKAEKRLYRNPDSIKSRLKRLFSFDQAECKDLPLVCFGPIGKVVEAF